MPRSSRSLDALVRFFLRAGADEGGFDDGFLHTIPITLPRGSCGAGLREPLAVLRAGRRVARWPGSVRRSATRVSVHRSAVGEARSNPSSRRPVLRSPERPRMRTACHLRFTRTATDADTGDAGQGPRGIPDPCNGRRAAPLLVADSFRARFGIDAGRRPSPDAHRTRASALNPRSPQPTTASSQACGPFPVVCVSRATLVLLRRQVGSSLRRTRTRPQVFVASRSSRDSLRGGATRFGQRASDRRPVEQASTSSTTSTASSGSEVPRLVRSSSPRNSLNTGSPSSR